MLFEDLFADELAGAQTLRRRRVVDALLTPEGDVWVMVARGDEDLEAWLTEDELLDSEGGLRFCRAVLDRDTVVLGSTDPDDALISGIGREARGDE